MSVFYIEKTKKWGFRKKYKDPFDNKTHEVKRSTFNTKKEATIAENEFINKINNNKVDTKNLTLTQLIELYHKIAPFKVKEQTLKAYTRFENQFYIPSFGNQKIDTFTKNQISDWINDFAVNGYNGTSYSDQTIRNVLLHLCGLFTFAVQREYLTYNVVRGIRPPKKPNKIVEKQNAEENFWDLDTFNKFIETVDNQFDQELYNFAFFTGLRIGEITALQWKDIDFKSKTLTVRQTYSAITSKIGSTKTDNSYRTIDLPERILNDLKLRYNYLKNSTYFTDDYFVFGDKQNLSSGTLRNHFNKSVSKANVKKITFHGLRHSHASLLLSNPQIPEHLIADRLGHSVEMLRETYSHIYKKSRKEMVEYINKL